MDNKVSPSTLQQWLTQEKAVLVDVREPAEYQSEHIAGACNIPLSRIHVTTLPHHEGKKLVLQCLRGSRSNQACSALLGAVQVPEMYQLEGGLEAWKNAGLPVNRGSRSVLPLDRQVQLTVGVVLLLGFLLGTTVNPGFYWLMAIIGVGLSIAGLTGFCGLALLIARMPWNK